MSAGSAIWRDLAGRSANDNWPGTGRPGPAPAVSPAWRLLLALEDAMERARQRRELARLSEPELKDLGWTRCDALAELSKPFWR
ncbi:DUF1127 domain-containing protein [Inquilinus limosus]|uniref:DUF1127 domain-containing protein n=1 Tax=Inquilinus limosus TaxID=171674 RepID=UPI0004217C60|nr:DUF1127 domain-containing protein [Inquilinus limosus]